MSDSNVRVPSGYTCALVRELEHAELVTNVFAGTGERSLGAALENLQLGAVVLPGIAASALVSSAPLTVGKSMAMRRDALAAIGGFAAVGHVLAEDHLLGRRFHDAGFRVGLSLAPVENRNIACSVRRTLERHSRGAKLRRTVLPSLFAAEPLISPLLVATAGSVIVPASRGSFARRKRGMVESDACVPERASSSWFPLSRKRRESVA